MTNATSSRRDNSLRTGKAAKGSHVAMSGHGTNLHGPI
jgi:hypothetical protein